MDRSESQGEATKRKMKVCVVGAGAAGLCAARHLAGDSNMFEFIVFEKSNDVGGTWIYTDRTGVDENGLPVHSSMYRNLRTNLPKEVMNFPDYREIKGGSASCVSHDAILDYLKNYADHFKLRKFIRFNTVLEYVKPEKLSDGFTTEKWKVKVKNIKTSESKEHIFDAIMICSGHYFDPYIPQIPGLGNFKGRVMHSHDYRRPEDFAGKRVILLGASSSGIDIAIELTDMAERVYLSHNNDRVTTNKSVGFTEVRGIECFENGKFVLNDDSTVDDVNVLIFCTGYHFAYPFLDESCGIQIDDNYVSPLYKHMVNIEHPTMCIIGIPMIVVPFPMFHMQVQYFLALLHGKAQLPPKPEMLEDARLKVSRKRHAHILGNAQWSYNDSLAREGGFETLPQFYKLGYDAWHGVRRGDLRRYKNFILVVAEDELSVRIVDPLNESS